MAAAPVEQPNQSQPLAWDEILPIVQPILDPQKSDPNEASKVGRPTVKQVEETMADITEQVNQVVNEKVQNFYTKSNFDKAFKNYYQYIMKNLNNKAEQQQAAQAEQGA